MTKGGRRKRRVRAKSKSDILLEFICKNPGLTIEEIANGLNWKIRNVKAILTRLKNDNKIESKIFPSTKAPSFVSAAEIENALRQINLQFTKLESVKDGLVDKENESFEKCVEAQLKKDQRLATIYANHCAQIRELKNILERGELILRRISLVLGISQLGRGR